MYLVESILDPSKMIKKGYETVTISTDDGRTLTGLLGEDRPDAVVLRDPAQDGKPITIPKEQIEERKDGGTSIMPAGLVNNLGTRQQFLDLVRYLMEIAEKGPERARELKPDPSLLAAAPLPESERDIDHAGLIAGLDQESFERGEAIYDRVCVNCHGTKDRPGSLPTSLRFASGTFKNGSDPLSMYQTLTRGFGLMTPQTWMVPRQKYDVIHYIREAYLKTAQPRPVRPGRPGLPGAAAEGEEPRARAGRDRAVGDDGLRPEPDGDLRGRRGRSPNIAYKGIAVRLDPGPGGVSRGRAWVVFDHDTLRFAAAWTGQGFIDWNGINFNGQHQVHPRIVGKVQFANPVGPGWANPETGRFDDLRERGRDGRPYGPLPRRLGHYQGLYRHGDRIDPLLHRRRGRDPRDARARGRPGAQGSAGLHANAEHRPVAARPEMQRRARRGRPSPWLARPGRAEVQPGRARDGSIVLRIPAAATPRDVKLLMTRGARGSLDEFARKSPPPESLEPLTQGGPSRWPERLTTRADDRPRRRAVRRRRADRPRRQPLALPAPALGLRLPARRPHARPSAPGTATSGSSRASTGRRRG